MLRIAFCFGVGLLSASAFSTFDLVFVADAGTNSIHRFDGDTGVYLGQFGTGILNAPRSISIDKANGRLYVADNSGLFQFDLWSGTLISGVQVPSFDHIATAPSGNMIGSLNYVTAVLGLYAPSGTGWYTGANVVSSLNYGGLDFTSSQMLLADKTNRVVRSYNYAGGFGGTYSPVTTWNMTAPGTLGQLSINGTDFGIADGTNAIVHYGSTTFGSTLNRKIVTELSSLYGFDFGHGTVGYYAGRNAANTSGLLVRGLLGVSGNVGTYGNGILQQPRDIAVIAAPEPGQWAAMGLGVMGLLIGKRRKK